MSAGVLLELFLSVESKWYWNDRYTLGTFTGGSSGITEPLDGDAGCELP